MLFFLFPAGGAGEGKQHLRPDGAIKNQHQVKTDAALPAYCTPPNPCPVGYTGRGTTFLPGNPLPCQQQPLDGSCRFPLQRTTVAWTSSRTPRLSPGSSRARRTVCATRSTCSSAPPRSTATPTAGTTSPRLTLTASFTTFRSVSVPFNI